jgi:hypothetical protein
MAINPPPRVHFSTGTRVIFAAFALGGVLLVLGGLNQINNDHIYRQDIAALRDHGVTTVADAVGVSFAASDEPDGGWTTLRVRFVDTAGKAVVATTGHFGQGNARVGSPIDIVYDAKNPELIDLVHNRSYPRSASMDDGGYLGIAVVVLGILITIAFILQFVFGMKNASRGWYPDRLRQGGWRFWDGRIWTDHTSGIPIEGEPLESAGTVL